MLFAVRKNPFSGVLIMFMKSIKVDIGGKKFDKIAFLSYPVWCISLYTIKICCFLLTKGCFVNI